MHKNRFSKIICTLLCIAIAATLPVSAEETDFTDFFNTGSDSEISEYCHLEYEKFASSDAGTLYVNTKSGRFYLEDAAGARWYSNPDMGDADKGASGVYKMELQSLLLIGYQDIAKKQYGKANSETGSVRSGNAVISKLENGFEAVYSFPQMGFTVPVEITLDSEGINASVDMSKIKESNPESFLLCSISLLPYFGAGAPDEKGSIIVADGSGCEMDFNNGRYSKLGYSSHIYGNDLSKFVLAKGTSTYPIMLPVYGIRKASSAITAVVTDGAARGTVWCYPNGAITSYANVYTSFELRATDTIVLNEYSSAARSAQLYQKTALGDGKTGIKYMVLTGDEANYNGMAAAYKKYLCEKEKITLTAQSVGETSIDFYGVVKKKKVFLGFPVIANAALSELEDISDYINRLAEDGVSDISVTLREWSADRLAGRLDRSLKPAGIVGNKKELKRLLTALEKNGGKLYLGVSASQFKKSGKGYNVWGDTAKALSNAPAYNYTFYNSNYQKNTSAGRYSLLTPKKLLQVIRNVSDNGAYTGAGLSFGNISVSLYSDFTKKSECGIAETAQIVGKALNGINNRKTALDTPADYALKNLSLAQKIPETSSRDDIFDRDIPFTQLVLSGIVPYTCEPINSAADERGAVLNAAAYGSRLQFELITNDPYIVSGTSLDRLYGANSSELYKTIKEYSEYFKGLEKAIGNGYLTHYSRNGEVSVSRYSNGATVTVDRANGTVKAVGGSEYSFGI